MKSRRFLVHAAIVAGCGLFSTASHAVLITNSDAYNFDWSYDSGAAGILSGTGNLRVAGFGSTSLTVAVTLNNASSPASDRLTSFGFGIDPNATAVSFADTADGGLINVTLGSIPSLATIEVCAFGGPNCSGGGNGGILGGASDSFQLILTGTWGSSVNIAPIGFKYQTGAGSFEFTTDRPPPTSVPEPATLSLLGAGLIAIGFTRRRRRAS